MSYSFRLPEEEPVCECFYDDVHDRMDREDCHFHCDLVETADAAESAEERKPPESVKGSRAVRDSA